MDMGEGYTVFGKLVPSKTSLANKNLPLGVAHHFKLRRDVKKDQLLTWNDAYVDQTLSAVKIMQEIERICSLA